MEERFLDTAYAIALSAPQDAHHERALTIASEMDASQCRLMTTRAVILEIGNALSKLRYRKAGVELLLSLEEDPRVEILPLSEDLFHRGQQLFASRVDKEWSITDCISFVAMKDRGIEAALTTDEHFEQAGFRALLRNPTFP